MTGGAQATLQTSPKKYVANYEMLKTTIIDQYEITEHVVPMKPGHVARISWQPIPQKHWTEVDEEMEEMLCLGTIEPSCSP